jgi:hypothetical protein
MLFGRARRRALRAALLSGALLSLAAPLFAPAPAQACGCFAPPDVATPIVQAGEKILFVNRNGILEMHVQIQYSGKPGEFGWIVPLPALPKNRLGNTGIDVGSVELFDQLDTTTRPTYVLQNNPCFPSRRGLGLGCGAAAGADQASSAPESPNGMQMSPLVTQDSVGPYEFAVLRADSKTEMLNWLNTNRYVIPAGTDSAVGPYIRPGAYFLALRLKAGLSAGDVQPVVLRFQSDLATVPITLTSVAATPNMGILIWILGSARAIPRNYFHTVINDAQIDWLNQAKNYSEVVTKAVAEANGKHAFVTDFAGRSSRMVDVLDTQGRYDVLNAARTTTSPVSFVQQILPATEQKPLDDSLFPTPTATVVTRGFALNGQLFAVLGRHIPMPSALIATGIKPDDYYQRIDYYLNQDRRANPARYADIEAALANFKPAVAAQELQDLIVTPTLEAGQLFREVSLPKLTRLYTVLSPEDMNLDPAFSFNPGLPDVSNIHNATLWAACPDQGRDFAELSINSGTGTGTGTSRLTRKLSDEEASKSQLPPLSAPYSQRIEQLGDTGAPVVKTDNTDSIKAALEGTNQAVDGGGGCTTTERRVPSGAGPLALLGAGIAAVLLRRRVRATRA